MENGTYLYAIKVHTPLGWHRGYLELMVWNQFLNGYLTLHSRCVPIREGKLTENHISFQGDMKTTTKFLPYQAEGEIAGPNLSMVLDTGSKKYRATGVLQKRRDYKKADS